MQVLETDEGRYRTPAYWESVFSQEDPWEYDTEYERTKYERTLSLVPAEMLSRAAEIACAEGHFTARLAPRVGKLFASDISPTALARARARCAGMENVEFAVLDILSGSLPQKLDLIVCSEVLYYFPLHTLPELAASLATALRSGGYLLTAHANAVADDRTRTGFDWNHDFGDKKIGEALDSCRQLALRKELRTPLYAIRLYQRTDGAECRLPPPEIVELPIESLPPRIEKGIIWDGAVMTRSEASVEKAQRIPILAYHSIADHGPQELSPFRVSVDAFRRQIRFLRQHGFHSITLSEWTAGIEAGRPLQGRPVIITFDDGYKDFLQNAWPLLERADFSATVFVVTDHVGKVAEWDRVLSGPGGPLPLMNWDELRALQENGVDIQSHTATHPDLLTLTADGIQIEGRKARDSIRGHLGVNANCIAFPYGRGDSRVTAALSRSGYTVGLNTGGGASKIGDTLMELPRIQINADDDLNSFAARILPPACNGADRTTDPGILAQDTRQWQNTIAKVQPVENFVEEIEKSPMSLSSRLDRLIGDFVSLQLELLKSTAPEASLQRSFRTLFGKPVLRDTSEQLKPYQEISPGVQIGFEGTAQADFQVVCKRDHSVSPESFINTIGLTFRGPSRWFTMELALDWRELSLARNFQITVFGEPSRPLSCRVAIRFPRKSGSFLDTTLAQLELTQTGKHVNRAGKLVLPELLDIDMTRKPRLLFFFDSGSDLAIRINYMNCYFC